MQEEGTAATGKGVQSWVTVTRCDDRVVQQVEESTIAATINRMCMLGFDEKVFNDPS
jgi:hypothetical protein